jgi:hypothetical protein
VNNEIGEEHPPVTDDVTEAPARSRKPPNVSR